MEVLNRAKVRDMKRSALVLGGLALVLLIGSAAGNLFGERAVPAEERDVLTRAGQITSVLLDWLPEENDPEELVYDGIRGMLDHLDPHSNFLTPNNFEKMRERQEGSFYGVGIIISRRVGRVTVIAPIAGTPAARKGLRAGDIITEVDGDPTEELSLDEVVDRVRGPEGTTVELTIERPGLSEPMSIDIERARIPTNSVRYAFILESGVGYVRLSEFSNTSVREVRDAVDRLRDSGMRSLIFDLRDNPGGALNASIGVADLFMAQGQLIVSTRGRTESNNDMFHAPGDVPTFDGPVVVLVNNGSASASEIVAGAVQDHDRGLVIGEPTWGKGLVQTVYTVRDAGLALTTARYYTPSGRCIQRDYDSFIDYITFGNGGENGSRDTPEYQTENGREVHGRGGIVPDVLVESRLLAEPVAVLYGRSAYFQFAIDRIKDLPEEERASRARDLVVDDELLDRFWRFVEQRELLDHERLAELQENEVAVEDVRRALKIEVLNATVGLEAGYRVVARADEQIDAAVEALPQARTLWESWRKSHAPGS